MKPVPLRPASGFSVTTARLPARAVARDNPEEIIHRAVVNHLKVRCKPCVFFAHVPNGEARTPSAGGRLKAMGTKAGMPDLMLVIGGKAHFLELKADTGRVSPAQTATHADLELAGAVVAIAYGLDAALDQLTAWGALR